MDDDGARGVPRPVHDLPERGGPAPALQRPLTGCRFTRRRSSSAATATDAYGDYLFYAGRLERLKRLDLALDALASARRPGPGSRSRGRAPCARSSRSRSLAPRSRRTAWSFLGFVSVDELLALYACCRAAYYAPVDEDYGYVTVEAFLSRKPVRHHHRRRRAARVRDRRRERDGDARPSPRSLADAIDRLWALPEARLRGDGRGGPRAGRSTSTGTT